MLCIESNLPALQTFITAECTAELQVLFLTHTGTYTLHILLDHVTFGPLVITEAHDTLTYACSSVSS